jgi:site-specific recombinase XerD
MSTALRQRMHQDLQLTGLAEGTQEAYLSAVRQLAAHFQKAPDRITEHELREYLLYLKNQRQYKPSSLRIAACGITFFYTYTVPRDWAIFKRLRIPRSRSLPTVLSIDEVRRLIDAVYTPHNKAYFWTVYSLGLRLQDGLNLQVPDIDSAHMVIHVHRGKGSKDRYVPLPPRT